MPIVKVDNFIDYYRYLATSPDIHVLSGRSSDELAATEFASRRILDSLDLRPEDVLLDIGCGDGCLLRLAESLVRRRVGLAPTEEERSKLETMFPNTSFCQGVAQDLPFESATFSRIVCNGVLILLGSEATAMAAIKEIARVAKPQAHIWLGEIPTADELSVFGKYQGSSALGYLRHQLRRNGGRALLSSVKEVCRASTGRHTLVLNSASIFHVAPEKFIDMALGCGLHSVSYCKHRRLDRSGNIVESPYRYNYIFVK